MVSTEQYSMEEQQNYYFSVNDSKTVVDYNMTIEHTTIDIAKKNHTVMASCLMFGSGVFGNLLALSVLATSAPEQRRTLFYKLVAGLAITDLIGILATSPVVISVYVNNFKWVGGIPLCHYFSFMMIFASFTTMFIVCAMSVERYICVRHPYLYHTRLTARYAKISLIGSWVISLAMASLPLIGLGRNTFQYPKTWCFFDYTSREPRNMAFNIIYATTAMLAIGVTMCCNLVVTYTLLRLRRKQGLLNALNGTAMKNRSNSKRYAELQMVVLLIGITIVFTCCYSPLVIYVFLCQTSLVKAFNTDKAMLLMIRFASFNQILDPWVYILFRRELVWKVIHAVKYVLRIKSNQDNLDITRIKKVDDDDSCYTFCLRCLCEPPATGGNYTSRPSMTYTRSPSYIRRVTRESIYSNGHVSSKLIIESPSPLDATILKSFKPVELDH